MKELIDALHENTQVHQRQHQSPGRNYWPHSFIGVSTLLIGLFVYFNSRLNDLDKKNDVRRQADIAILKATQESADNQRKIDQKLDDYLGVHVEQMGPNHRKRYWETLKPYFQGENK